MPQGASQIILLVLLLSSFYFMVLRPQQKRLKAAQAVREQLRPGLRVMTTSGLQATLVAVENDVAVLEVAPGVQVRWAIGAVGTILDPAVPGARPDGRAAGPSAAA
ncbi:MAG: preprotein translocase subunit YajC [Actinomycetota bacterium]|nr:preprotein translocase subunit YajC [Actinomycetota bacterium]